MKILKRVEVTDKEYEVVCIKCTSILAVTIADLSCATYPNYDGDSVNYVGLTCPVCDKWQETKVVSYRDVEAYTRLKDRNKTLPQDK